MRLSAQRKADIAKKLLELVDGETTDMCDEVLALDPAIYADPQIARRERERIFRVEPMVAAHASEIPNPGDWILVRLNEVEAILVRQRDGEVAAYLNVCRHRGARLVSAPSGQGTTFKCPYHGWVYSDRGELRGISYSKTFGELPCADTNLVRLPCEERHGFVWVIEDPAAKLDLDAFLGPEMDTLLSELGLDTYHVYKGEVLELDQNWKIMAHGLLDGYHVRFLHGDTIAPYVYFNIMGLNVYTRHAFNATPRKRMDEMREQLGGEIDVTRYAILSAHLSPNTQLVLHPHHVEYWTMYQDPDSPDRCRAHMRFLTPAPIETDEDRIVMDKNYKILIDAVIQEDVPAGNGCQATAAAPFGPQELYLGRNEVLNQLFQRNYDRMMAD